MPYEFLTTARRYRDTTTGQFVSNATIWDYTERMIAAGGNASDTVIGLHFEGSLSAADTITAMKGELKNSFIQEYTLGRGGRDSMTARDWGTVGGLLSKQYAYLPEFQRALEAGELSEAQAAARARQYFNAAGEGYERGNAAAFGAYALPAYPRDGSTECMNGCQCRWRFEVVDEAAGDTNCYWELNPTAENCPTCLQRSTRWYPLMIRGGRVQSEALEEGIGFNGEPHRHETPA